VVLLLSMIRGYCCQVDTLNDEYMSFCWGNYEPALPFPEADTDKL
jgi:hypothetical protein